MPDDNRQWILRRRPEGALTEDVFELVTSPRPEPQDGQALVRVLALSLDPANRAWIAGPSYRPAVAIDGPMDGFAVGRVVASKTPELAEGDLVSGDLGWQDYRVVKPRAVTKLPAQLDVPVSYYLGVLGITGLTAYFGLLDIGRPEAGQTVVVSGAAGATGSVVVQLARIHGCRVVGIAGRPDKCAWVRELGADVAIDYRAEDVRTALKAACPDGIDVYYDNVGGPILQQALLRMRRFGRIVCCGAISQYDAADATPGPRGVPQLIVTQRLRMQGFIVTDFAARFDEGRAALAAWLAAGKLHAREDRLEGLEQAPAGLIGLLGGENVGKRWIAVAEV